jgi:hypothetical protein
MIMLDLSNEAFSKAGLLATKYGVTAKALLAHVIEAWVSGEPMEPPEPEIHNRELRCLQIVNGGAAPMTKAQVLTLLGCAPVTCQSVLLRLTQCGALQRDTVDTGGRPAYVYSVTTRGYELMRSGERKQKARIALPPSNDLSRASELPDEPAPTVGVHPPKSAEELLSDDE